MKKRFAEDSSANNMKKRGISPIIATVLLVVLVVIIAAVIFLWIRRYVGEACQKQGIDTDVKCQELSLEATRTEGMLNLNNKGSLPINSLRIKIERAGKISSNDIEVNLLPGQSKSQDVSDMSGADVVYAIPILKGLTKGSSPCENVCENVEIEVLEE